MIAEQSLGWPLVLRMPIPDIGDTLAGSTPQLSPDLATASWATGTGVVDSATNMGGSGSSWQLPRSPTFLEASDPYAAPANASVTLALDLGELRGLAVYLGFGPGQRYDTEVSPSAELYGVKLELLNSGGSTIASVLAKLGPEPESGYRVTYGIKATASGATSVDYELTNSYEGHGDFGNPWLRMVGLYINEAGQAEAGFHHPYYSSPEYPLENQSLAGTVNLVEVKSLRMTVSNNMGINWLEIRKTGLMDINGPTQWWRANIFTEEIGAGGGSLVPPANDWRGVS